MRSTLEEVQTELRGKGISIRVTSAYRSASYNRQVGGASKSQHVQGNAVDFSLRGMTTGQKQTVVNTVLQKSQIRGFGYYPNSDACHMDVRSGSKMAWGTNYRATSIGQGWPGWMTEKVQAWLGDNSPESVGNDDSRQGTQTGNTDTNESNTQRRDSKGPLDRQDHGEPGGGSTSSAATRLPTHEPWPGHPKSKKPPRFGSSDSSGGQNDGAGGRDNESGKDGTDSNSGAYKEYKGPTGNYDEKVGGYMERYRAAAAAKGIKLSDENLASIFGNLGHESKGMKPGIQDEQPTIPGSRGGLGWSQWTGPRRREFEKFVAEGGGSVYDDEWNYKFFEKESLSPQYIGTVRGLQGKGLAEGTRYFDNKNLGSGVKNYASRDAYANRALTSLKKKQAAGQRPESGDAGRTEKTESEEGSAPTTSSATGSSGSASSRGVSTEPASGSPGGGRIAGV